MLQAGEILKARPDEWSMTLCTDAPKRGAQYIIEIECAGVHGAEFVLRYGDIKKEVSSYEKLHVGKLSQIEVDVVWNAFKETLDIFSVNDPKIKTLDGGFVRAELRVGSKAIRLSFMNLGDTGEASLGLNRVIKMIEDHVPGDKFRGDGRGPTKDK